jgi:hypothetical protein
VGVIIKCDMNGETTETDGELSPPVGSLLSRQPARLQLPAGWTYLPLPGPDGIVLKIVCGTCLRGLWIAFGILPEDTVVRCVRCDHDPVRHRGHEGCKDCGCELSEFESTDSGWAQDPEEAW